MRASLIANGKEIGGYLAEDGIKFSPIYRNRKTVVMKDGTEYRYEQKKKKIDVTFLDTIYDNFFLEAISDIESHNAESASVPATISYSNFETGETANGFFYVQDLSYTVSKSISNLTIINGASFTLEEM